MRRPDALFDAAKLSPVRDALTERARLAAAGDAAATRDVVSALAPKVLRIVRALLGRQGSEIEDVTQEAMLAFVRALPAFRADCPIVHYASRIAFRTAIVERRRYRVERSRTDVVSDPEGGRAGDLPDEQLLASRRRSALRAVLLDLPEAQAETIALRVLLGCSLPEVARATGVPINTVRSRVRLAKEALKKRIDHDPALAEALEVDE